MSEVIAEPVSVADAIITGPAPPPIIAIHGVGMPGPAGKDATGMLTGAYTHTQSAPSPVWTVQHNLGFNPSPTVLSDAGDLMLGWVPTWVTPHTLILTFPVAVTGTCYVS